MTAAGEKYHTDTKKEVPVIYDRKLSLNDSFHTPYYVPIQSLLDQFFISIDQLISIYAISNVNIFLYHVFYFADSIDCN